MIIISKYQRQTRSNKERDELIKLAAKLPHYLDNLHLSSLQTSQNNSHLSKQCTKPHNQMVIVLYNRKKYPIPKQEYVTYIRLPIMAVLLEKTSKDKKLMLALFWYLRHQ